MSQVAVLTPSFPRYKGDYHGVFIKHLCDRLSKHVSMTVIAPRTRTLEPASTAYPVNRFPYMPSRQMEYIAEVTIKNAPSLNKACLPAYLASAYLKLVASNVHLIHTHLAIPLGIIASINPRKTPQLITCHGSDITYPTENPIYLPITRRTLKKADYIATVSEYIRKRAINIGADPEKTETIYLGVNTNRFKPRKRSNEVTIGTLGRLVKEKHIDEILFAAKHLQNKMDFQIRIGGDGPDQDRLMKLASILDLDAEFTGRVLDPVGFHQSLDVFILASRREGLSISLQEAMSSGCASIVVDGYGCREIISDGVNGYIYPPDDYKILANKIQQAIDNRSMQRKARATIIEKFNSDQAEQRYLELYRRLGIF